MSSWKKFTFAISSPDEFLVFSNEKVFTVAAPENCQNDSLDTPQETKQHDTAADRLLRTRPYLYQICHGVCSGFSAWLHRIRPNWFLLNLRLRLMVCITETSCWQNRCYRWSASWPAACSSFNRTVQIIVNVPLSNIFFILPNLRPTNSPDLNTLDYRVWGCLQDSVYQKCDITELKQCLVKVWLEFRQTSIDDAIDDWRKRLRSCVHVKGHHFKHLLQTERIYLNNLSGVIADGSFTLRQ